MKIRYYLAMAVAALVMTNCSQEEEFEQVKQNSKGFIATIEGASRSAVNETTGAFSWTYGDKISVYNGASFDVYANSKENVNNFAPEETVGEPKGYAVYPAGIHSVSDNVVTVNLPSEYKYGSTNAPMLATVEKGSANLAFKHLAGVMRFVVKNVPENATKFVFTTTNNILTGNYTVNEGQIKQDGKNAVNNNNSVTITFDALSETQDMTFYVPMPVGTYGEYTVAIKNEQDLNLINDDSKNVSNTIGRRTLLLMPEFIVEDGELKKGAGSTIEITQNEVAISGNQSLTINTEGISDASATLELNYTPQEGNATLSLSDGSDATTPQASTAKVQINPQGNTPVETLNINTPTLTVELGAGTYNKVEALTAEQTLIIGENVTIGELVLKGGNVKLEGDLALETPLVVGIETTIDLNGYQIKPAGTSMTQTLNTKDALILVRKGGSLTIKDSSTGGTGRIDTGDNEDIMGAIKMTDNSDTAEAGNATLEILGGTIKGYYYGIMGNGNGGNRNGTVITMNGGTIEAGYCENDNTGIFHPQLGTLTISGGSITGYKSAVEMRSGTLTISGGTFESTGSPAEAAANANGNTITGAAIAVSQHTTNQELNAEISSGTFTGVYALYEEDKQDENVSNISMAVTGGTFNGSIFTENCKTAITGGTFSDPSVMDYLGANANVTVNMTKSYEGPGFVTKSGQTVSLKMGSNVVYTVKSPLVGSAGTETLGFQFLNGSTVSIEGGKITSEEAKMLINNYTNLTLKDVELAPTIPNTMNGQSYYVLSNNSGEVKLEGNTSIKAPTMEGIKSFAFDVCKYRTYDAPVVTVNTTGTIEGLVEVSGGTLNVTNGTFKNEIGHCVKVVTGTANFDGGEFTAQEVAVFNMAGNVKITKGTFTSNDNAVISGNGTDDAKYKNGKIEIIGGVFNARIQSSGYVACGIYHPQAGTLKVTGGTFNIENGCGILMRGGSLDMTDSQVVFNFTGAAIADGKVGDSRIVVPCKKEIVQDACSAYYDAGNINIKGVDGSKIYTVNSSQN